MNPTIQKQLLRLGFEIKYAQSPLILNHEKRHFEIPTAMNSIIQTLRTHHTTLYYDKWNDGLPTFKMKIAKPQDCTQYFCLEKYSYFSFMIDQHYSFYMMRADDKNPENPMVYYIDHDAWQDNDAMGMCRLADFLTELRTQKEADEWIKENQSDIDRGVDDIGLLAGAYNKK